MSEHTMIFGDDGSASADLAWLWINNHEWPDWAVEVVHATTRDGGPSAAGEAVPVPPRHAFAESRLVATTRVVDDDPRLALSRPADLVVIGPRGAGLMKSMHIGSTAEWLMIHPPAPLVVVRHGRATTRAVVCTDGSTHAEAATRALREMPWIDRLVVTVVGVDDGRVDAELAVDTAARQLAEAGADVRHRILQGDAGHELLWDPLESTCRHASLSIL